MMTISSKAISKRAQRPFLPHSENKWKMERVNEFYLIKV